MLDEREVYELALKHAVFNAYKHAGKAELSVVVSKVLAERPDLRKLAKEVVEIAKKAVEAANAMTKEEQRRFLEERYPEMLEERREERREGLPPLPGAEVGRVVTRFAPNPDFALHIGNSRVAIISYEYARMYKGKLILRFEDTDPRTKKPLVEAYDAVKEDLKWLGIKWDEEYVQSLRMKIYYDVAKKLIEVGGAYVDTLKKSDFVKHLASGAAYPPRNRAPEENLELFDKMLEGGFGEGEAVVRVKTDWSLKDPSIVDWVAFRVIDTDKHPHPIVGSAYVVWPTYNFAAAVDDYLMGVTHIIRGKEHETNTIKQKYLYKHMGWSYPTTIHVGRLKLEGFVMSKSLLKQLAMSGEGDFAGYDDPRFGTLAGLRARGITPEAVWAVMESVGVKPSDATVSFDNLAAENRKRLDGVAPRIMFVRDPVFLKVAGLGECVDANLPFHPQRSELGARVVKVCDGDSVALARDDYEALLRSTVRLMGLGNFLVEEGALRLVSRDLEEAKKQKMQIVHWVHVSKSLRAVLLRPEGRELKAESGLVEEAAKEKPCGANAIVQLVRYGFARIAALQPVVKMIFAHE